MQSFVICGQQFSSTFRGLMVQINLDFEHIIADPKQDRKLNLSVDLSFRKLAFQII